MSEMIVLDPAPEEWLSDERKNRLLSELGSSAPILQEAGVLDTVLNHWIRRELAGGAVDSEACLLWSRTQWGHRLESLFLQQKQDLDQVSCKLLRVAHPGLATEIYHRLLNQEASFEQLSMQFGVGPERFHGGVLKLQYVKDLPQGLGKLLAHLDGGELMKPLKFANKFVVIQLIQRVSAVFDDSTKQLLLSKELQNWIQGMSGCMKAQLGLPNA